MDGTLSRPSGLPRPSRLPQPKASSGIPRPAFTSTPLSRPRAAQEQPPTNTFAGPGQDLHSPKLRGAPSAAGRSLTSSKSASLRQSLSRDAPPAAALRTPSKPGTPRVSSTTTRRTSTYVDRSSGRLSQGPAVPPLPSPSRRDASDQFISADTISQADEGAASPIDYGSNDQAVDLTYDEAPLGTPQQRSTRPRPSLSERTIETLARLPSSPAIRKKSSTNFYEARPASRSGSAGSRPGSSYNSDGSAKAASGSSSRPQSRGEPDDRSSAIGYKSALPTIDGTPDGQAAWTPGMRKTSARPSLNSPSKLTFSSIPDVRSPSPEKTIGMVANKALSARPLKPKSSVNAIRKQASQASLRAQDDSGMPEGDGNGWDGSIASIEKPVRKSSERIITARKSSAALREQIAKAKASKRAVSGASNMDSFGGADSVSMIQSGSGFDFDINNSDPFGQQNNEAVGAKVLLQRIAAARGSGKLNISALGLPAMPEDVLKMYEMESIGTNGGSWSESVDLTRLVAADNEFETLDDAMFPDISLEDYSIDDDDTPANIFGGLETMDLHGNKLVAVPLGFRRLCQLTSLNLSSNRLSMDSFDILAEMTALRDLKLANNSLSGTLHSAISNLTSLEILDLKGNALTALPNEIVDMKRLRILNVAENALESVPFAELAQLPLTELVLRKNKLSGTLMEPPVTSFESLQTLDISANQIKLLVPSGSMIELPVLHTLSMSMNRMQELPDMSSWASLLTLTADENTISVIPQSFCSLMKLRQADFSGNDIRVVPAEISRMDNLSMIRLSGNPLRDKKFVTATTDEIKEVLSARLEPPPPYQEQSNADTIQTLVTGNSDRDAKKSEMVQGFDDDYDSQSDGEDRFATPPTSSQHTPSHSRSNTEQTIAGQMRGMEIDRWEVTPGGILDRSRTDIASLSRSRSSTIASNHQVRQVQLHHNLFTSIPVALSEFGSTLTSISLAFNQIAGDGYLVETLELPALRELNLASNRISSMAPLLENLRAPNLEKMDVSLNRITVLPEGLNAAFPKMTVLLAANNLVSELNPDAVKGLRIVEVSNNDIGALDPRLGLLAGDGGLERLEVSGNRFKVPRWNILEQGTHATLRWLRSRLPVEQVEQWERENGEDGDDGVL